MEEFVKGQIIVANFPFSEIEETKRRPALIIGIDERDMIICKITTNNRKGIPINEESLDKGKIRDCYIIPTHITTIDKSICEYRMGKLKKTIYDQVVNKIIREIT